MAGTDLALARPMRNSYLLFVLVIAQISIGCSGFARPAVRGVVPSSREGVAEQAACVRQCALQPSFKSENACLRNCPLTQDQQVNSCMSECEEHGDDVSAVVECLEGCPDVQVCRGERAKAACPSGSLCYDHERMRTWIPLATIAVLFGASLTGLIVGGVALDDNDCQWLDNSCN